MDNDNNQFRTLGKYNDRISQRGLQATAVKAAVLAQTTLSNTIGNVLGPFSVNNGSSLQVSSYIANSSNPENRIAAAPYGIIFMETSPALDNIIGSPQGVAANTGYQLYGPTAMPQFTPIGTLIDGQVVIGGNDGNNVIFLTELVNNTGSTQVLYYLTNSRIYTTTGGATV